MLVVVFFVLAMGLRLCSNRVRARVTFVVFAGSTLGLGLARVASKIG